jgi:hypothetical protein
MNRVFFATEPLWSLSLCNILSDEKMGVSVMNTLGLSQVYMSHLYHDIENSSFLYKSSVGPGFSKRIMPILFSLCYNGSLVTRTVVSLPSFHFILLHRKNRVQQLFYCCVCVRCRGNVFTEPLPRNVRRGHTDTQTAR